MKTETYDVVVVGAGAAGVGVGVALQDAGIKDFLIVDRHGVGASFDRWPAETTFLTPSFPTNSVGMLDLNAIAIGTSPAYSLIREHPTGRDYGRYLRGVAKYFELPVESKVDIAAVRPEKKLLQLDTNRGPIRARHVVWGAGEFQYPNRSPFPGAGSCRHTARVKSYRELEGEEFVIIGGYESGLDAAIHLASNGKQATVLAREATWESESSDPSISLSTYTHERLETLEKLGGKIQLVDDAEVVRVRKDGDRYVTSTKDDREWTTETRPILATGFLGSHRIIEGLYEEREDGFPLLSEVDSSTIVPNLFFVGPSVRHENHVFCFIFKFRQRFAVVANAIAERLGVDASGLEAYRDCGMFLDDLSCCGQECAC